MKVITANVNGIRAAAKKSFFQWLQSESPDFVCIQETKAQLHQLEDEIFHPKGYHCYYFDAEKKGYSGVAIYCKEKPTKVTTGLGWASADQEGRYIQADFEKLSVASLYLPSGSSGEDKQLKKNDFLEQYGEHLKNLKRKRRDYIICGDWNIAHKNEDLKNWKGNRKNSGFLPEERAWLDYLFDDLGYIDAFREINQEPDQYTWWSNRGQAWANNVGWRIDYQILSPRLKGKATSTTIYKDERFSDHSPLIMEYDLEV
ncbi:MAG: exodeoxyribonuclease III [Pseudomonadales bacterium]|nr:exodeoxyribonuclease III [Pseudomonadales bacterium]